MDQGGARSCGRTDVVKITGISVFQIDLPLIKTYWLSGGRLRFDGLDSTIVRIATNSDVVGWGEGCPWGVTYLPAFAKGTRAGLEEIAPHLLGLDPRRIDVINRVMDTALPGHPYIKSALDSGFGDAVRSPVIGIEPVARVNLVGEHGP